MAENSKFIFRFCWIQLISCLVFIAQFGVHNLTFSPLFISLFSHTMHHHHSSTGLHHLTRLSRLNCRPSQQRHLASLRRAAIDQLLRSNERRITVTDEQHAIVRVDVAQVRSMGFGPIGTSTNLGICSEFITILVTN